MVSVVLEVLVGAHTGEAVVDKEVYQFVEVGVEVQQKKKRMRWHLLGRQRRPYAILKCRHHHRPSQQLAVEN